MRDEPTVAPVTQAPHAPTLFIARQPIFTASGALHGYELLHREGPAGVAGATKGDDQMSSEVLVNAFLSIGIAKLTGHKRAFINFSRSLLLEGVHSVLHPGTTVIEVLERVEPTDDVIEACARIVEQGYTLALDDFVYSPDLEPLLHLARIVKVDVLGQSPEALASIMETLRPWPVEVLAERVESAAMHDVCRDLGCRYFQGFYFARPETVEHRRLSVAPLAIMRLIALLRDERTTDAEIERAFQGNVVLTVKLLRAVNSVAVGGRGVSSIRFAVQMLGHSELTRWLSLMLVTSTGASTGAESELLNIVLRRARMCELLAAASGQRALGDASFIVGLFSLLDAVLKAPMSDLLAGLDLAPELSAALQRREGPLGHLLELVEFFEQGAWDEVLAEAGALQIPVEHLTGAFTEGTDWASERLSAPDVAG